MSKVVDQLNPRPAAGSFTGPVNVNELNRILRRIQIELAAVEAQIAAAGSGTSTGGTDASYVTITDESATFPSARKLQATSADGSVQAVDGGAGGNVTLSLVGDSVVPGASQYYGTDGLGVKGFFAVPTGGVTDGDKGDITVSAGGTVWTIDNAAVTYAKMQSEARRTVLGRRFDSAGDTEAVSVAGVATSIIISSGAAPSLGLVNDSAAPGNSRYYGTDSGGTKGFFALPAGGGSWTEFEQDFGTTPVYDANFVVLDGAVSGTSKIAIAPSGNPGTGRPVGDWQWDGAIFAAVADAGFFTVYCTFLPGPIVGPRKIYYQVS